MRPSPCRPAASSASSMNSGVRSPKLRSMSCSVMGNKKTAPTGRSGAAVCGVLRKSAWRAAAVARRVDDDADDIVRGLVRILRFRAQRLGEWLGLVQARGRTAVQRDIEAAVRREEGVVEDGRVLPQAVAAGAARRLAVDR